VTSPLPSSSARVAPRRATITPFLVIAAVTASLYANWVVAIARFQPNVMFMDQWDFFYALFYDGGWWDRFIHQHGPVREGLGFVLSGWILEATDLDVRYDSLWIATLLVAATGLALRLKAKMAGPIGIRDAWIPVLCLSLGQFETVLTTPNASHSVLPLMLILLAANVWLSPHPATRYPVAAALAFALTFTGFGLFAGAVITALLAAAAVQHVRRREYRLAWLAAAGLAGAIAGWVLFSYKYIFQTAVEGFRFPWTPWTDYLRFVALMLNLPTWHTGASGPHYRMGGVLAFVVVAAAIRIAWLWIRRRHQQDDVLVLLMASGVLFIAMTAVGRIPLGVTGGEASRYLSLMMPVWLAVYLVADSSRLARPIAALCVWLLAVTPYTDMVRRPVAEWPGTFGLRDGPLEVMTGFGAAKAAWADVYLATGSLKTAQAAVLHPLYPRPDATRFEDKLRILRERDLSFFSGDPSRRDYLPWLADDEFSCPALRPAVRACR
jgi:hypothetical protein